VCIERYNKARNRHISMAKQASATVQVDKNGRMYLPASTRKALNIHGEAADLDLRVEVLDDE